MKLGVHYRNRWGGKAKYNEEHLTNPASRAKEMAKEGFWIDHVIYVPASQILGLVIGEDDEGEAAPGAPEDQGQG